MIYIGPVWYCNVLQQVKSDKSGVTSQERHVKSDIKVDKLRVTSPELPIKSEEQAGAELCQAENNLG